MLAPIGRVPRAMFVTGCHRSGTSLMASVLSDAMAALAPGMDVSKLEKRCDLGLNLDNPRGFFESAQLLSFNDALLVSVGCCWDEPPLLPVAWSADGRMDLIWKTRPEFQDYALERYWVDKDPRLCLTYPIWVHLLLRRIPLVAVLRKPMEVAVSIFSRNGYHLDKGLALWFLYNHHLAASLLSTDLLVGYEDLLISPADQSGGLSRRLAAFFEAQDFCGLGSQDWQELLKIRVDPGLNRSFQGWGAVPSHQRSTPELAAACQNAYDTIVASRWSVGVFQEVFLALPRAVLEAVNQHKAYGVGPMLQERFDGLEKRLSAQALDFEEHLEQHRRLIRNSETQLEQQSQQLGLQSQQVEQQSQQIERFYQSWSWRITAPLRAVSSRLKAPR